MSETITACENVCRDFGAWFTDLDPKVFQGLATLLAAFFAAGTALYIAKWVYPSQKRIDEVNRINEEKRDSYRNFFTAAEAYFWEVVQGYSKGKEAGRYVPPAETYRDLQIAVSRIALTASPAVLAVITDYRQALKDYYNSVYNYRNSGGLALSRRVCEPAYRIVLRARLAALIEARREISTATTDESALLGRLFPQPSEEKSQ